MPEKTASEKSLANESGNAELSSNRYLYVQIWYRLFKYISGEYYGEYQIKLWKGYFIDIYPAMINGSLALFQIKQNRSPLDEWMLARLQFYQRWFEPISQILLLPLLKRLLRLTRLLLAWVNQAGVRLREWLHEN